MAGKLRDVDVPCIKRLPPLPNVCATPLDKAAPAVGKLSLRAGGGGGSEGVEADIGSSSLAVALAAGLFVFRGLEADTEREGAWDDAAETEEDDVEGGERRGELREGEGERLGKPDASAVIAAIPSGRTACACLAALSGPVDVTSSGSMCLSLESTLSEDNTGGCAVGDASAAGSG